ncbi:MAG: DUF177 domain-containing protein [Paracoccus sp. (in: a-proteobacteria)]|nr:DUF177 domain-containing protein [Paracoccus sp. (in: a-proteobacteria)]
MTQQPPIAQRLRVAHLATGRDNEFVLSTDAAMRKAVADYLDIRGIDNFEFQGAVRATGRQDWLLTGRLRARVVQDCVVTLDPVTTRIDEEVRLLFTPELSTPEAEEVEMGDENTEPLGQFIDIGAVALEALALALPPYPRREDAELPEAVEEEAPEETRKPFAGLGDLLKNRD